MTGPFKYLDPNRGAREKDTAAAGTTWWERRRKKIADEIERNRRGEYTVPTWVLAVLLVVVVVGWAALIIFG